LFFLNQTLPVEEEWHSTCFLDSRALKNKKDKQANEGCFNFVLKITHAPSKD
jgi:hypothetical protein